MSNTFNTELKVEYLDDFINRASNYEGDPVLLKAETTHHYNWLVGKSPSMTSKIVGELMGMWSDCSSPYANAQKELRELALKYAENVSFKLPLEMHRAALLLAFPMIREIASIITEYGNSIFTPGMVTPNIKGDYGSNTTLEQAVPKALLTMVNLGMIKRVKRGIYKSNLWPVSNTCGLLASLIAVQAFANEGNNDNNMALRGLSFEITHEFVDSFKNINYASLVGENLWNAFKASSPEHSLQYVNNQWMLSNEEFMYPCFNGPLAKIPKYLQLSVADFKSMMSEEEEIE